MSSLPEGLGGILARGPGDKPDIHEGPDVTAPTILFEGPSPVQRRATRVCLAEIGHVGS